MVESLRWNSLNEKIIMELKQFNAFGIKPQERTFVGEKIKMKKVLNKKISIFDYKLKPSIYPLVGNGQCLHLQIEFENKKRVTWTSSVNMQEMMFKVPKDQLPIETTIIEDNERYEFS